MDDFDELLQQIPYLCFGDLTPLSIKSSSSKLKAEKSFY